MGLLRDSMNSKNREKGREAVERGKREEIGDLRLQWRSLPEAGAISGTARSDWLRRGVFI